MLGWILKPRNNFIDYLVGFYSGYFFCAEMYIHMIIIVLVGSFISGFLESWYKRKTKGTFKE